MRRTTDKPKERNWFPLPENSVAIETHENPAPATRKEPRGDLKRRAVRARLFGQFGLEVDGVAFRLATPRKSLQVIAYLLLNRAAPVSRDYLAFLLWPDDEEGSARAKLRATLSDLLKALPSPAADFVIVETDSIAWNPQAHTWLDVDEFVRAAQDRDRTQTAIELYRGDLLPELYDEWLDGARERHRETYLRCLTDRVSELRRSGDIGRAIEVARTVLAVDPWREDIIRRIMGMRYESGDRAGALNEYVRFGERLRAEMGIEPMAETALLAERIGEGRETAGTVEAETHSDATSQARRDGLAPLVGRARELERLTQAWSRAKQGRGSLVLLGGEPGVGKSRLALELVRTIEEDGGRVLAGATGIPESFPYQVFVEALRAGLPLVGALGLGPTWFAALATLLPELPARVGPLPALPTIDDDRQRLRLFEAIARAIVGLSKPRPLLVLLEDLHWASQSTFDALAFVARQASGARVLIVGTFRDDEAHRRHPLRRLQRDAEFQGVATTLTLPPLGLEAVEQIVARAVPPAGASGLAESLHARSGGNPLFLSQLLAAPAGMLSEVPPTIASLVAARIAALSEPARTVAEVAAMVGERFAVEIVRDVSGWDDATALGAVDELLDRRIIRETTGRGIFRYTFAHQLVQQAILDGVTDGVRERSRRIARVLGDLYPERAEELAADIGRHLEVGGDAEGAATQYVRAARRAIALGALDESTRNLEKALALSDRRETIREALFLRTTVNERRGDADALAIDLDGLMRMADEADDDEMRCAVLLRRVKMLVKAVDPRTRAVLDQLQACAARSGNLQLQADAASSRSLLLDIDLDLEEADDVARRAQAAYARIGDNAGSANATASLARVLSLRGEGAAARAAMERVFEFMDDSFEYEIRVRILRMSVGVAIDLGDREAAALRTGQWLDLAIAAGDRREEAMALMQTAWPIAQSPRFMEALPILADARTIALEWGQERLGAMADVNAAEIYTKLGAFDRALEFLRRAIDFYILVGAVHAASASGNLALALAHSGQPERGRQLAQEPLRSLQAIGRKTQIPTALENLAEAEWRCGRRRSAIEHFESALAMRRATDHHLAIPKDTALLAALHAEEDDLAGARRWLAQVPRDDASFEQDGHWPQRSAWAAAFASHVCGDATGAHTWLRRAHALYAERLAHLEGEGRETFAALSWHRAMLSAHTGVWPDAFW